MRTHARARAFLCRRALVCACERVLPFHRQSILAHVCARVCAGVCVRGTTVRAPVEARRGPAVLIARPAAPAAAHARLWCSAIGFRSRARSAAGITWTSRTLAAGWAGRWCHTSVVDAAGAIYVIGGRGSGGITDTRYQDVWVSRDGGERWDLVKGGGLGGVHPAGGYSEATTGGTWGWLQSVLQGVP